MVAAHIDWVPTLELFHVVHATIYGDSLKRFVRAGGIVSLGTDYMGAGPEYDYDLGMPVHELVYMDQIGLTPMQAIVAGTRNAAYTIGHPELGVLKKGKIADVIAVKGNPLKDLELMRKVTLVVRGGVVAKYKRS
jgi:imidazolonepropionase-like amidohydrolase